MMHRRSSMSIFSQSGELHVVELLLYKLPLIYLFTFALRFLFIYFGFKLLHLLHLSEGLTWQGVCGGWWMGGTARWCHCSIC